MATTTQSYTGDGVKGVAGQTQLTFDFPYIKQSDVKVSLNGVTLDTTKYTFPTATSIQFNAGTATSTQEASGAPKSGVDILFYRQTDVDSAKAIFATGSGIRAKDLNNNIDQALFALQEVQDIVRSEEIEDSAITSAKIKDDSIVNADVNSAAAIDGTKISPDFGSQHVTTTGHLNSEKINIASLAPIINFSDSNNNPDYRIVVQSGEFKVQHTTGGNTDKLKINTDGHIDVGDLDVAGNINVTGNLDVDTNITVDGTVDGRDIAADGTKLDTIETNAKDDQTASEIRTLVEAASDSNVFSDADHGKLNDIEANATRDQTDAEIRTAVENATDSNVFTDADHTKLNGISAGADVTSTNSIGALTDVDTGGVSNNKILKYDASVSKFIVADESGGGGGGGGSSTFTGLSDTPTNFGSAAGKTLKVNSGETAIEFVDVTTSFAGLSDTPSLSGQAGKTVKINSNEDGVIYETVNTDLVVDTTPQLGGDLGTNGKDIIFGDDDKAIFGTGGDLKIYHDSTTGNNYIKDESEVLSDGSTDRDLIIQANHDIRLKPAGGEQGINILKDSSIEFYANNDKKFECLVSGPKWHGTLYAGGNIYFGTNQTSAGGGRKLNFDNNLSIYSDGSNGIIRSITGNPIKYEIYDPNDSSTTTFTLPDSDGGIGTFLTTNGSGVLSFSSNLYEWKSGTVGDLSDGDIILKGSDANSSGTVTSDEFLHWDTSQIALKMGKYGQYKAGFSQWYTKTDYSSGDEISNNGAILSNTSAGGEVGIFGLGDISIGASDSTNTQLARFKMPGAPGGAEGSVELQYITNPYAGNKSSTTKLATTSTGVTVTGTVTAGAFSGNGSGLTGVGATGASGDQIFWENGQTVTTSYTIGTSFGAACNAMSAGPITINDSVVVTVDSGDTWTIV